MPIIRQHNSGALNNRRTGVRNTASGRLIGPIKPGGKQHGPSSSDAGIHARRRYEQLHEGRGDAGPAARVRDDDHPEPRGLPGRAADASDHAAAVADAGRRRVLRALRADPGRGRGDRGQLPDQQSQAAWQAAGGHARLARAAGGDPGAERIPRALPRHRPAARTVGPPGRSAAGGRGLRDPDRRAAGFVARRAPGRAVRVRHGRLARVSGALRRAAQHRRPGRASRRELFLEPHRGAPSTGRS